MKFIERFANLMCVSKVEDWCNQVFKLGNDLGYKQTRLAILPDPLAPIEAEHAFQYSNYSATWINKYTTEKMHHVDPTVAHCISKSTPLIWAPEIFSARKQKEMYEEACGYGIRSGVTLPIHGAKGELGIVCFVSDINPDKNFHRDAHCTLPELSYFRDFIFESSLQFIKRNSPTAKFVSLTPCELECLKWSAEGKSSWEIGQILHCSEAAVSFHFANIRRKFGTSTRRHAVAKAIRMGIINPT
ncbi:MAG: LuxR family transcriptional regulator [Gallionellaceae bacterium]|jgi:LuxR family quorum-sensing transcriptional regulator LasR